MCVHLKYMKLKWEADYNFKQTNTKKERITGYEIRENILFVEKIIFVCIMRIICIM